MILKGGIRFRMIANLENLTTGRVGAADLLTAQTGLQLIAPLATRAVNTDVHRSVPATRIG
jgi:hypothetical protein